MTADAISTWAGKPPAIGVLGTGSYVPDRVLENAELAASLGIAPEWIERKTGITERRVAAPGQATSDLAAFAATKALAAAGVDASEIDLIVVATSTPDYPIPPTACLVQAKLGATRAAAMDMDAVCTGFIYAVECARALLVADSMMNRALVIGADTYSRILDYRDRSTAVLFGDGAGAVVLGRVLPPYGIRGGRLASDGGRANLVGISAGGSRHPAGAGTVAAEQHYFRMNGRAVREFAEEVFPTIVKETIATAGADIGDVDLLVPHQANVRLLEGCARMCGLRPDQIAITADRYGNTGAASVPLTLDTAVRSGLLRGDDDVLLVAFGGGMTWGGMLMHWSDLSGGKG